MARKVKAKASSKETGKNVVPIPRWVGITDAQRRKIAKNLDYRLKSVHLGTISKRQVPRGRQRAIYGRLWPLISPQSFRHYVVPAYMAVPDIDRSIEDWDDDMRYEDKAGNRWPRMYVVETFNYQRLDAEDAPEESETLDAPVLPWDRLEETFLFFELDDTNKPYLKPILRDLDANFDAQEREIAEAEKPGLRTEYKVETLADMFGFAGEGEKVVLPKLVENEYQILIPAVAIQAFNAVLRKKKTTGTKIREAALAILAKHSVLCYPTFCALTGDNQITIQAFRQLLKANGYHRTGTVGKTAIFRPWSEMYPEGVPEYVLGRLEDAGEVPA